MSKIKTIKINNFKFFTNNIPLELEGKHLLLFGENGSGKSSIYWALYNIFQAAIKDTITDFQKYFKHPDNSEESLINIYAEPNITNGVEDYNSFIEVETTDNKTYRVSQLDTAINGDTEAIEVTMASDFLNYKVLYKFQDFWNGEQIDLADIFVGYILPYIKFTSFEIRDKQLSNAYEMWQEIRKGPGTTTNSKGKIIQVYKHSEEYRSFQRFSGHFENEMRSLIDFINANAPEILNELGYSIDFHLEYEPHTHHKKDVKYECAPFKIVLKITSYLGKTISIHRPQSFLNEAKFTAIAIAIRLAVLKKRINTETSVLKFIVFDDIMISLDMNNRDKLIEYLLSDKNIFTKNYQLLFLTHDKNLYDFLYFKIKKLDSLDNWKRKGMFIGKDEEKEYPIIIDSEIEFIDKAKKHFEANDYVAASIYIRKELEKIVRERLPDERKYESDGKFLSLQNLWDKMNERYNAVNKPIPEEINSLFKESKLFVLNPQAHYQNYSFPIYKIELEKAFKLIDKLNLVSIPERKILLAKGMELEFKHPTLNYTFKFKLLSDFCKDSLNTNSKSIYPKCKVIHWQFEDKDFFDTQSQQVLSKDKIDKIQKREDKLDKVIANIKECFPLTDNEIIYENTKINNIWKLKDIIDWDI